MIINKNQEFCIHYFQMNYLVKDIIGFTNQFYISQDI